MALSPPCARKAVCLVGPTGSGKTGAAVLLAGHWPAGVINADSRQLYRDVPLITAQPDEAERAACPHYLYGYLPPDAKSSAGQWAALAARCMDDLAAQGRVPIFAGGTGLYLRALLDGMADIPAVDPALSRALDEQAKSPDGRAELYARLEQVDPAYAARIHRNDRQRIVRALEVFDGTGKPLSWWHANPGGENPARLEVARENEKNAPPESWTVLRVGLDISRPALKERLAHRIDCMLEQGALDEARRLFELCPDRRASVWSGIGCAELHAFLTGELDMESCRELWLRNTAAYAKRQMTWFRADKRVHWLPFDDAGALLELAGDFLAR